MHIVDTVVNNKKRIEIKYYIFGSTHTHYGSSLCSVKKKPITNMCMSK